MVTQKYDILPLNFTIINGIMMNIILNIFYYISKEKKKEKLGKSSQGSTGVGSFSKLIHMVVCRIKFLLYVGYRLPTCLCHWVSL